MKFLSLLLACALFAGLSGSAGANLLLQIEITNNAPNNGVYITPTWVGFHNGLYDTYDSGSPASAALERVAEDGDTSQITLDFGADATRVQDTIGAAPIAPGASASTTLMITENAANQYLSYASMVLPSSDYFIANGNPLAHDISSLFGQAPGTSIMFDIGLPGSINDAGTEVNDFDTSAGNPLFPQLNLPAGQGGPNKGADQNGNIAAVAGIPYTGFLNTPGDLDTNPEAGKIDFNRTDLYPSGIATVAITVIPIPEPATIGMMAMAGGAVLLRRRGA